MAVCSHILRRPRNGTGILGEFPIGSTPSLVQALDVSMSQTEIQKDSIRRLFETCFGVLDIVCKD